MNIIPSCVSGYCTQTKAKIAMIAPDAPNDNPGAANAVLKT